MKNRTVEIKNRKAEFQYEILEEFTAGIKLVGTEIKSIRQGKAQISESFCEFQNGELFVINMHIQEYSHASHFNHNPKSERKLLLKKHELRKLEKNVANTGLTIIPLRLFISDNGWAKLDIALCRGKKLYDKRESLRKKDDKRRMDRIQKEFRQ